jgi:hypothetical protein
MRRTVPGHPSRSSSRQRNTTDRGNRLSASLLQTARARRRPDFYRVQSGVRAIGTHARARAFRNKTVPLATKMRAPAGQWR